MTSPILPGQTIGVLGGGQLGRMLAMVARRWGFRVHVFTPEVGAPASHFAQCTTVAPFEDHQAMRAFADQVDVITFEFENVATGALQSLLERRPVRPAPSVFATVQNRAAEKQFLLGAGIPCAPFRIIPDWAALQSAAEHFPLPAVLKSSAGGYDGKGQALIRHRQDVESAWQQIGAQPATLEQFVDLQSELSVLVARDVQGRMECFGPVENRHARHILDVSVAPAQMTEQVVQITRDIAMEIAELFDLVGLICIEFFLTERDLVLVNEIAPRPHNSGHLTIEAAVTSQFEQQLRAICGLPLGSFALRTPAAMANLLGDLWESGEPHWGEVARFPATYLHLYDKVEPRSGRKMGHITTCANDPATALQTVTAARQALRTSARQS